MKMKMICPHCKTTWQGELGEECPGCGKIGDLYNMLRLHVVNGTLPFVLNTLAAVCDNIHEPQAQQLRHMASKL